MNKVIYPYPTCSDLTAEQLLFSCQTGEKKLMLEPAGDDTSYCITNEDFESSENPLTIKITMTFRKLSDLFFGKNPVASDDSQLGIAVRMKFRDLSICRMIPANDSVFSSDVEDQKVFTWEQTLLPGEYFGDIEFLPVIYVVDSHAADDSLFAAAKGTIVGYLNSCRRSLELNRSQHGMFTVVSKNEGADVPLWKIRINSDDDFLNDDFMNSFQLVLNKDNIAFPLLYSLPSSNKVSPLLFETLAESFRIFIVSVLKTVKNEEDLDSFLDRKEFPVTSVGANAIYLLKNVFPEINEDFVARPDFESSLLIRKLLMKLYKIVCRKETEA